MELTIGEALKVVSDKQEYLRETSCGQGDVLSQMLSIPRNSFTASRLSHISSYELSSKSEVALLGGVPQQWFDERKSLFWSTVRRVKLRRRRQFADVLTKFTRKPLSSDVNSRQNSLQFVPSSFSSTSLQSISFEDESREGCVGEPLDPCFLSRPETKGQICYQTGRTKYVLKSPIRYTKPPHNHEHTKKGIDILDSGLSHQEKTHPLTIPRSPVDDTKKCDHKNEMYSNEKHLATLSYLGLRGKKIANYEDQVSTSIFSNSVVSSALRENNASDSTQAVPLRYLDPEPTDTDSTLSAGLDSGYEDDNARKHLYLEKIKSVQSKIELNSSIYLARRNFRGSPTSLEREIGNFVLMEKLLVITTVNPVPNYLSSNIKVLG